MLQVLLFLGIFIRAIIIMITGESQHNVALLYGEHTGEINGVKLPTKHIF